MPGPPRRRGAHLLKAHEQGLLTTKDIETSAMRVLEIIHRTGKAQLPDWEESDELAVDLPGHRRLLRRAGAEGKLVQCHTHPFHEPCGQSTKLLLC